MDDLPRLRVIPPPQVVHLNASALQRELRLLDLHLESAVSQREGKWVVKKNTHRRHLKLPNNLNTSLFSDLSQPRRMRPSHDNSFASMTDWAIVLAL